MKASAEKLYRVQEFSRLAGVTVRTLHHYDRLGLLKPGRTASGYRVYRLRDMERLEQVVALKFLGLPLQQIRQMLDSTAFELPEALRMQRQVLEGRRQSLDHAIRAIAEAEHVLKSGKRPDSALLRKIIEVIEMQNNTEWSKQYYSPEAQAKIAERAKQFTPEMLAQSQKDWSDLFAEVEAALGSDPGSALAQDLAARWSKLVEGFTGGDPEVSKGLNKMYQDRPNWPANMQQKMSPFSNPKVSEFIQKAIAIRKGKK